MIVVGPANILFISGFFITNFDFFGNSDFTQQLESAMHRCNADFRRYFPDLIVQVIVCNMPPCGKKTVENNIPLHSMPQPFLLRQSENNFLACSISILIMIMFIN